MIEHIKAPNDSDHPIPLSLLLDPLRDSHPHILLQPQGEIQARPRVRRINQRELKIPQQLPWHQSIPKSYFHLFNILTSTKALFNTIKAIFFPKQEYFPYPHASPRLLSIFSKRSPFASNHLSGRNSMLSSPYTFLSR